jgi:hypothetical protein
MQSKIHQRRAHLLTHRGNVRLEIQVSPLPSVQSDTQHDVGWSIWLDRSRAFSQAAGMDRFPYSPPPCCRVGGVGKQRNFIVWMFNDLMFKCFTSLSHVPNAITWMTWHDMDLTRLRCLACLLCRKSWTQNRSKVPKRSYEFFQLQSGMFHVSF